MYLENITVKVYDCFLFYNELDILEIRLNELYDVVDCFVIVESDLTFTGLNKRYILSENLDKFSKFADKIRIVKVDDNPKTNNPWDREHHQRNCIFRGLHDATKNDLIITSDCDEIPRSDIIAKCRSGHINHARVLLNVAQFNYRLNYFKCGPNYKHCQIIITKGNVYAGPQKEREFTFFWTPKPHDTITLDHGGWHWTFYGDDEHGLNKIKSYSHTEANTESVRNNFNIEKIISQKHGIDKYNNPNDTEQFEYVIIDDYFPIHIRENVIKYNSMIIPNADRRVTDFYKGF